MNNILKGCLISLVLFFLIGIGTFYFISKEVDTSFSSDKVKVEKFWNAYISQLHIRDSILLQKNPSRILLYLINKTERNIQNNGKKKDLLYNEYILNDSLRQSENKEIILLNDKLNESLLMYNSNVKEFNLKYSVFPYNYLRRRKGVELYDYFNINYGQDNTELINQQKRTDEWIKNGGELK